MVFAKRLLQNYFEQQNVNRRLKSYMKPLRKHLRRERQSRYCLCNVKGAAILFLLTGLLTVQAVAQHDSLSLVVRSEYRQEDSAKSYLLRIEFSSSQKRPITLYKKPLRPFVCCWDFEEEIGVEMQKLDSACYKPIGNCADCDYFFPPGYEKDDFVKLEYGETVTYRGDISLFDRYGRNGKQVGFYGDYRCRAYWVYYLDGKRNKLFSKWMYINFPGYK